MGEKIRPINVDEIERLKDDVIPDEVILTFNELIVKNFHNGSAKFSLNAVVQSAKAKGINKQEAFDHHWFDVEPMFRAVGWQVKFDNPGYNESYEAYFVFTKPKKG